MLNRSIICFLSIVVAAVVFSCAMIIFLPREVLGWYIYIAQMGAGIAMIPPYLIQAMEIWRRKSSDGINVWFLNVIFVALTVMEFNFSYYLFVEQILSYWTIAVTNGCSMMCCAACITAVYYYAPTDSPSVPNVVPLGDPELPHPSPIPGCSRQVPLLSHAELKIDVIDANEL